MGYTRPPGPYQMRVEYTSYALVELEADDPHEAEEMARAMADTLKFTRQPGPASVKMLSRVPPRKRR